MQIADEAGVKSPGIALVDHGGIKIAIAQYHFIFGKTGFHQGCDMLRPIGHIEKQFCLGHEIFARRIQQNGSDFLSNSSTARLAGHHTRLPPVFKKGSQKIYLSRFTASLDAFQGEKHWFGPFFQK